MKEQSSAARRQTFLKLLSSIALFLKAPDGRKARWLLAGLLLLMLGINGMNVANSFVGRYFMSAIEGRNWGGFHRFALLYVGVFAGSTLVGVLFRFTEERLGLLWRNWLTRRVTTSYIDTRLYLNLSSADAVSNPDQRMSEDVRQLTTTTLSFLLMILNGTMAALSFSGVLWAISPKLFVVAVLYAAAGSAFTIWLGRPLIRLNYSQADREADFRSALIQTRVNADGIALAGKEREIHSRLMLRIDALVENLLRIIAVNRNLNFFTTGYNYMIQLIPVLIVAPLFMRGGVEFGVIGQATMAFATLLGAFSLVITQFQAISSYASVVSRLGEFVEAFEKRGPSQELARVGIRSDGAGFNFRELTLLANSEVLVRNLNVDWLHGRRVMVFGSNRTARSALFRAAAGIHENGTGTIVRPPSTEVVFLPERPFLPNCRLSELLIPAHARGSTHEEQIHRVLKELRLTSVIKLQSEGDEPRPWQELLSFHDAKLLGFAGVLLAKPRFVFIDELDSALDSTEECHVLDLMEREAITCVCFGSPPPPSSFHGSSLEIRDDGSWIWKEG